MRINPLRPVFPILLAGAMLFGAAAADTLNVAQVRPRLADRFYLESVLMDLFGPEARADVDRYVLEPDSIMGGPCDVYEQVKIGEKPEDVADPRTRCFSGKRGMTIPMVQKPNMVREGYILKVCTELSNKEATLKHFLKFSGVPEGAEAGAAEIALAFQAFHPGRTPSSTVGGALRKVASVAAKSNHSWAAVVKTLCMDPSWQIL